MSARYGHRETAAFRPVRRQFARAIKLSAKAPLTEPAIRALERERDGVQRRAALAHQLAAGAGRAGDAEEAALQAATAETHEAQAAAIGERIAALRGAAPQDAPSPKAGAR